MKTKVVQVLICIFKLILRFIYFFLKLLPVDEKKLIFCSRQSDRVPLDFILIRDMLRKKDSKIKTVCICKHTGNKLTDHLEFMIALLKSMYHMSTSSVCIIDSYWPAVSLLKHKKELTVIQLWHSIGKVKKSGYQTIGLRSGRKSEYAKSLHMHENYDYVIAGAPIWNKFYCESFNIDEDKILNFGLPRVDYLLETEQGNRLRFYSQYPEWEDKKVILYAPTFRRNMKARWQKIIDAVNGKDIVLIIRKHPGQTMDISKTNTNIFILEEWETIDLLAVCDYLITDYSAIAIEAAVLNKKTYYWVYDYDKYIENNGLNIDLYKQFPGYVYSDIERLLEEILLKESIDDTYAMYSREYLPNDLGKSTERIVDTIIKSM